MWGSFLDGWGIGSGKEVRLGRTGNWNELFKLFKQQTEDMEDLLRLMLKVQNG